MHISTLMFAFKIIIVTQCLSLPFDCHMHFNYSWNVQPLLYSTVWVGSSRNMDKLYGAMLITSRFAIILESVFSLLRYLNFNSNVKLLVLFFCFPRSLQNLPDESYPGYPCDSHNALLNHVPCNLKPERMLHVSVKVTSGNLQCQILPLRRTLRFHVKIFAEGSGFRLIFPWDFRHQNIPLEAISKVLSGSREHDLAKCPILYLCV